MQSFIGPHWGHVASFALPESAEGLPIDPGPAPHLGDRVDEAYKQTALDVIRRSSYLDPADGATVDIGPGALGDNSLGTMDGNGHDENPATGKAYPPNRVLRGGLRALARGVLGRRPQVRDAARPLEHRGERGLRLTRVRAAHRRPRHGR